MERHRAVIRTVCSWGASALVIPLMPLTIPVIIGRATWETVAANGELYLIAVAIVGGSIAVEIMLVRPGHTTSSVFQLFSFLVAAATITVTVAVLPVVSGQELNRREIDIGWFVLSCAVLVGLATAARQATMAIIDDAQAATSHTTAAQTTIRNGAQR